MIYFCYILESNEGTKYIGSTDSIERRIQEHNNPKGNTKRFTKKYSGWKCIYSEVFESKKEAQIREKQIKSWKGGRALKMLLDNKTELNR